MAISAISHPEAFNLQKPEEWMKWIKRFDIYVSVTKVTNDEEKVNMLQGI